MTPSYQYFAAGPSFSATPRMYAVNPRAVLAELATFPGPLEDSRPIRCEDVDMLLPASHDPGTPAFTGLGRCFCGVRGRMALRGRIPPDLLHPAYVTTAPEASIPYSRSPRDERLPRAV
jgi:hypothetical protein